jgi:hypothetical protein
LKRKRTYSFTASCTNGFCWRSRPIVVWGPCPG